MNMQSFYTRQMLLRYGRQLVAARKLARYDRLTGQGARPDEAAAAQRRALVERVAREVVENLIFSGSDTPVVREVHDTLTQVLGQKYVFRYPPADLDIKVFRITADEQEEEVTPEEKHRIMDALWRVTLETVDATMF